VVFHAAKEIAGVEHLDERYVSVLQQVRADVEIAHSLDIPGTPTYFVNGVKLTLIPPGDFETAIRHELRAAERTASVANESK
jgi:hypothetical protein